MDTKDRRTRPAWIVSACLCGESVRYDGRAFCYPGLVNLVHTGEAVQVCPERLGGLSVPRPPCEITTGGRVFDCRGCDQTKAFQQGARKVLELCLRYGIRQAILKDKSPSCGVHTRYDGSFTGSLVSGEGLTTHLLRQHGIAVYSEQELTALFGADV